MDFYYYFVFSDKTQQEVFFYFCLNLNMLDAYLIN